MLLTDCLEGLEADLATNRNVCRLGLSDQNFMPTNLLFNGRAVLHDFVDFKTRRIWERSEFDISVIVSDVSAFQSGLVRGFLHRPHQARGDALVLTHGAGGNCRSGLLTAVADVFCAAGTLVLRMDLPFRQRRPFGPPLPLGAATDRDALREAVEAIRADASRVFLGGHSYGGRQATILAAEQHHVADGLLLLSYPLHPPKKPNDLRTAHFPNLRSSCLFVHGTNDPFGSVEELRNSICAIAGRVRLMPIEKAGHDLCGGKFDIQRLVLTPFRETVG